MCVCLLIEIVSAVVVYRARPSLRLLTKYVNILYYLSVLHFVSSVRIC